MGKGEELLVRNKAPARYILALNPVVVVVGLGNENGMFLLRKITDMKLFSLTLPHNRMIRKETA